jgi:hypothetical protein
VSSVDPLSPSDVIRATVIFVVKIARVTFGQWTEKKATALDHREVALQLILDDVLKGNVRQQPGSIIQLDVEQQRVAEYRVTDRYGLWSTVSLAEGRELIAFCTGTSDNVEVLLSESYCEQLVESALVLEDVREAMRLEQDERPVNEVLVAASELLDQRGDVFARYVLAKSKEIIFARPPSVAMLRAEDEKEPLTSHAFEAVMRIIEDPGTKPEARETYIRDVYEQLGLMEPVEQSFESRFILALLKVLLLANIGSVGEQIEEVYLPNLLGLHAGTARYAAAEVLRGQAEVLGQLVSRFEGAADSAMRRSLRRWLEG